MEPPVLYVIAGPNGIGKTTSDYDFIPNNVPVINADEIAAEMKRSEQVIVNTQEIANGKALELMNSYLNLRLSFGGLNLLNHYFDKPDQLQLFDNSSFMQLVAEIAKGSVLHVAPELPDWAAQLLGKWLKSEEQSEIKVKNMSSVEEVKKRYLESGKGPDNI